MLVWASTGSGDNADFLIRILRSISEFKSAGGKVLTGRNSEWLHVDVVLSNSIDFAIKSESDRFSSSFTGEDWENVSEDKDPESSVNPDGG